MVLLNGVRVGELGQDAMGRIRFSYDTAVRSWLPTATPLSLSLTPDVESHEGPEVAAFLWGLLPENPAVLSRWTREFGVSAANPVEPRRSAGRAPPRGGERRGMSGAERIVTVCLSSRSPGARCASPARTRWSSRSPVSPSST
ncbi:MULTISPECIES: HipA N-terminal domain-containing protein [unclassified Nonomuraea]|uniref:HipA N-terminal domain-containing protein n=1 Tax=unclassified Nonomuraea TaxID=2593643 RepID=UPI0033943D20